jgi:HEAT repeat protein
MDAKAATLLAQLDPLPAKAGCLQILAELSPIRSSKNLAVCERLLAHADPEVRALALTALHGAESTGVARLMDKGMRDSSPDVRLQALESAQHFLPQSKLLEQSLTKAVGDSDPNVRQLGLFLGLDQPAAARDRVLELAASSHHPELASAALGVFQSEPSKPNMERIIRGLGHPSPDVREQARDILALNLQQTFTAPAEAMDWWRKNQHHYSEELVEIVP